MIEIIEFKNKIYPKFQIEGFGSQFAIPFAEKVCNGIGVDVGCNRLEWVYSKGVSDDKNIHDYDAWYESAISSNKTNSFPIDPNLNKYDALNFPEKCKNLDYIFSSHCLEHLPGWVEVMDYWKIKLRVGGVLFLYLPDYSQEYWRPWNNKKHVNIITPEIIKDYLIDRGYTKIFTSSVDLNNSFMVMCEKK
jgi:SAM-dependent methyltransferase